MSLLKRRWWRVAWVGGCLWWLTLAAAPPVVTFTLNVPSAYLRDVPVSGAMRTYSIFRNQTFVVTGRTADNTWVQLAFTGATRGTWILAAYGTVSGDWTAVPILTVNIPTVTPASPLVEVAIKNPATSKVNFTIAVKSAFARSQPSLAGRRMFSVFRGQTYRVRARTADGSWLWLDIEEGETWVPAAYGHLSGQLEAVAVYTASPTLALPETIAGLGSDNPIVPVVSARARQVYQYGLTLGNRPRAFSKVGDCQAITSYFLGAFDNPTQYRLGTQYTYLQDTIDYYRGSFARNSLAVSSGFNIASVLNPLWADPRYCLSGETPLACELRLHRPSVVIISMETWWNGKTADYEANLRQVVEFVLSRGVVPILATKADNVEGDGSINAAIVRVAQDYEMPLWNFWLAVQPLPGGGLVPNDGFHLTYARNYFDDPQAMQNGWPWRNLTALQALDAVRRGLQ